MCCLQYTNVKDNLIEYKLLYCTRTYKKHFDENLKKRFGNTYKFANYDINKFILLLQKGEYMGDWGKFNETSLREKEDFYSHLNLEDIADADYKHKNT